jgi:hypothetical protein
MIGACFVLDSTSVIRVYPAIRRSAILLMLFRTTPVFNPPRRVFPDGKGLSVCLPDMCLAFVVDDQLHAASAETLYGIYRHLYQSTGAFGRTLSPVRL